MTFDFESPYDLDYIINNNKSNPNFPTTYSDVVGIITILLTNTSNRVKATNH